MSEAVTKTITGRCEEVSEKNGWTAFAIDVGTQYPVRLSTKLDPLIELGRAASKDGGVFDWTYKESQGGENPHKPGTFYTNRYLEAVAAAGEGPESSERVATPVAAPRDSGIGTGHPPSTIKPATEGMTPEKWDAKERRDYRSRAWAQTLGAFTHTIRTDESPEDVFARLQPFQRKVYEDVCGMFAYDPDLNDVPFA